MTKNYYLIIPKDCTDKSISFTSRKETRENLAEYKGKIPYIIKKITVTF